MDFYEKNIIDKLKNISDDELDKLEFGVIGIDNNNIVVKYNLTEEKYSGYTKDFVIGKDLFIDIAPCFNNYLVALKFEENDCLDEILPYILSFKVKPVKVELRLLKDKNSRLSYVLIRRENTK